MRTLRLSMAGALFLVLLGGLGGVVVAQDEGAPASDWPHKVSGTLALAATFESGTVTVEDGRRLQRGYGSRDTIEMDDARLSGSLWHVWNRDYIGGRGEVLTGTVELVMSSASRREILR